MFRAVYGWWLTAYYRLRPSALEDKFTNDPEESTGEVVWEPMPEYGETEADRLYWRKEQ